MSTKLTMRDIAERAQVSVGTVSHVVNGTTKVREPLRLRVLEAIKSLGYQPSQLARGLKGHRTNMIGMIIPDITNPFFPGVVRGVEDVAFKSSYRVVLCNTDNDPAKEKLYWKELRSYRPAGLLVIPSAGSTLAADLDTTLSGSVPAVYIDRCPVDWKGDATLVANEEGAYQATRYLIKMGHTRLASVTGPMHLANAVDRLAGFRRALGEAKLEIAPEYIQEAAFDRSSGYRCGIRLLQMLPRPTAIFTANDLMALGVLHAMRELKINCPRDVSLISFDNLDFAEFTDPSLTSVHQPGYQMGATAARILLERILGRDEGPQRIVLPTELRIRQSVTAREPDGEAAGGPSPRHGNRKNPARAKPKATRRESQRQ